MNEKSNKNEEKKQWQEWRELFQLLVPHFWRMSRAVYWGLHSTARAYFGGWMWLQAAGFCCRHHTTSGSDCLRQFYQRRALHFYTILMSICTQKPSSMEGEQSLRIWSSELVDIV